MHHEQSAWLTLRKCRMLDNCDFHLTAFSLHFAAGFFGVQSYQNSYYQVIQIESAGFNNTLAPYEQCPNANSDIAELGLQAAAAWSEVYLADALKRLSPHLPGLNLTITDVSAMQTMCPYEVSLEKLYLLKLVNIIYIFIDRCSRIFRFL